MEREATCLDLRKSEEELKKDILNFMLEGIKIEVKMKNLEPFTGFGEKYTLDGTITFHTPTEKRFIERMYQELGDKLISSKKAFDSAVDMAYKQFVNEQLFLRTEHFTYDLEFNAPLDERRRLCELRYDVITQDFANKYANVAAASYFFAEFLKDNKDRLLSHFQSFDSNISNEIFDKKIEYFENKGYQQQLSFKEHHGETLTQRNSLKNI